MNFKELLLPLALAIIVSIGLQFYFRKPEVKKFSEESAGQMYEIKHDPAAVAPLSWGVNLVDEASKDATNTIIETDYARITFSSAGAAIEILQFKHQKQLITSIQARSCQDKAFFVAFDDKTPCNYTLVDQQESDSTFTITYQRALENNSSISKTFVINKHLPKIELTLNLSLTQPADYIKKLRIFYPAPLILGTKPTDIHAFVNDALNENALKIYRSIPEITHKTWRKPLICGITDRFFIHALINDPQGFTYRCAFSEPEEGKELIAQLEGHPMSSSTQWTLTFYCGPKQMSLIKQVDSRLEHLYEYGIWAPFSKGILLTLNFLYDHVHNYGLAILIFALLVKLLLLPLTVRGERNLAKQAAKQAETSRKLQYLQNKFRDDPERLRQEKEALLKQQGIGGMIGGCLPVLLQLPIFFALQRLMSSAIELYHAPFLWITDLSSPDKFYILPVLTAVSFLLSSQTNSKPIKQQFSTFAFALVIGAGSVGLPAGVTLYIATSMFLGIIQSYIFKTKPNA